jgi:hypothetical protein
VELSTATQKLVDTHETEDKAPIESIPANCIQLSAIVIVRDWVLDAPSESVASTVKVSLVAKGSTVPVMFPEESMVRPVGREPEVMLQVMAPVPPEEARVWE